MFLFPPLLSGCGNSSLGGDMYGAGYHAITNIDYSSVCISAMSARYSSCPGMTWHQMDVRQLSFADASFDVILEKATLDAIMVEEKSPWEVSPETSSFIHQALIEVAVKTFVLYTRISGLRGFSLKQVYLLSGFLDFQKIVVNINKAECAYSNCSEKAGVTPKWCVISDFPL